MLAGKKMAPENLGSVLVLGLGKSGKAVAQYCAKLLGTRVEKLFIAAGAYNEGSKAFVESLAGEGVRYAFGDDALDGLEETFDVCIPSPGIPFWEKLYQEGQQKSRELISEVEFAWRESAADSTWIAITGTNGKTTTTACCAHLLKEAGFAANAVGNIGDVCLDAVAAGDTQFYVAEVSSYQLASTKKFAPDVAVILNITPDHIHWHQTLEAYADAKFKVLENLGSTRSVPGSTQSLEQSYFASAAQIDATSEEPCAASPAEGLRSTQKSLEPRSLNDFCLTSHHPSSDEAAPMHPVAILNAVDDTVRAKVRELKAMSSEERGFDYIPLGTKAGLGGDMRAACGADNAAFLDEEGMLRVAYQGKDHRILPAADLKIKGLHNVENALAAASCAVAVGAPDDAIARGLSSFAALPHRIEPVGEVDGVACYNDSKATNVDATLVALRAFPEQGLVVLLGGDDKGTDLADLVKCAAQHARAVVCFGEAGPRFLQAFEEARSALPTDFGILSAAHMEDALDVALAAAHPGEVVLLSPACASFDEFKSFEHRGDVFRELVAERAKRGALNG